MRLLAFLVAALLALAGCSDGGSTTDDATVDDGLEATATTGVIRGVVIDATITPVAGATVTVESLNRSTETGEQGLFGFDGLEPGSYFLVVTKPGYRETQTSVEVEAGVDDPDRLRVRIERVPGTEPYIQAIKFNGFLTCGVAIIVTSVGCTTFSVVASAIGDSSVFPVSYDSVPMWAQSEMVWEHSQAAGGELIFEMTRGGTNTHQGHRETTSSPALAFWNTTVLEANADVVLNDGIDVRFFGGPHPLCKPIYFGCGLTLNQPTEIFVHNFYNFAPDEGWRFTAGGEHPIPE